MTDRLLFVSDTDDWSVVAVNELPDEPAGLVGCPVDLLTPAIQTEVDDYEPSRSVGSAIIAGFVADGWTLEQLGRISGRARLGSINALIAAIGVAVPGSWGRVDVPSLPPGLHRKDRV